VAGPQAAGRIAGIALPGDTVTHATAGWDTLAGNECGKAQALTTLSPISARWELWLRFYFRVRQAFPSLAKLLAAPLERLSFIHFGRWTLLREPAPNAAAPREQWRHTYLLFESNFNGRWDEYIDAFAYVLGRRMSMIWGGARGFPGPRPAEPFKRYIRRNELPASHFYSTYPEATTTIVQAALELDRRLDGFLEGAAELPPYEFARRFQQFQTEVQELL
jgi:hypothetical protein